MIRWLKLTLGKLKSNYEKTDIIVIGWNISEIWEKLAVRVRIGLPDLKTQNTGHDYFSL